MTRNLVSILLAQTSEQVHEVVTSLNIRGGDIETGFLRKNSDLNKAIKNRNWDLLIVNADNEDFDLPKAIRSLQRRKTPIRILAVGKNRGREEINEMLALGLREYIPNTDLERLYYVLQCEIENAILNQRKRSLEYDLNYKSQFIAKISHEMRTTLNSVILLSEILAENRSQHLSVDEIEYIDLIHGSSNNLLNLLNKILDLSKIQSGKMNIRIEDVFVQDFSNRTARLYVPIAKEKDLEFRLINELSEPLNIKTDLIRLEQVLNNLISNALKFTKHGHVHMRVYLPEETELRMQSLPKNNMVAFEVSDSGIGITPEKLQIIFESYVQAEGDRTQKQYGGTGLGLAISKEIAQILGGKLTLESEYGHGSTFTLYLPMDSSKAVMNKSEVEVVKIVPSTNDQKTFNLKPKLKKESTGHVLLVDNSTIHNMALKEFLSSIIKTCTTVESAQEAYEVLEQEGSHFDCIILDMYLPDAYGKDVLTEIRQMEAHKEVPVIIYSGKTLSKVEQRELLKDALAIVQKNVNSYKVLMDHIARIVNGNGNGNGNGDITEAIT